MTRAADLVRAAALAAGAGDETLARPLVAPGQEGAAAGLDDGPGDTLALACLIAERAACARDGGCVGGCGERGDGKPGDEENAHRFLNVQRSHEVAGAQDFRTSRRADYRGLAAASQASTLVVAACVCSLSGGVPRALIGRPSQVRRYSPSGRAAWASASAPTEPAIRYQRGW